LKARRSVAVVVVGVGFACGPGAQPTGLGAPLNACPEHPCSGYTATGPPPSCNAGVCTVDATPKNLVLIVVIPQESPSLLGGQAYLTTFENDSAASWACAPTNCPNPGSDFAGAPPVCTLPQPQSPVGGYYVDNATAQTVHRSLGNPDPDQLTTVLPAFATFRQLYGPSQEDAALLGLPVDPVPSQPPPPNNGGPPALLVGPNGGPVIEFQASLEQGCYERTMQPYAPYSSAFPPEIKPWPPTAAGSFVEIDVTKEETVPHQAPTFDIARADGLDGWTAYLRDITSKQVFSNVAPLSGSVVENVILATSHEPPNTDALTNLELVIAPPPGTPMPTALFAPAGPVGFLPEQESYPALPTPMTMTGSVTNLQGDPVEADLVFTAVDITNRAGVSYSENFEFQARATASVDPRSGASTYSVLLPRGDYQIAVRPLDTASAVTVVTHGVDGQGDTLTEDIVAGALRSLQGSAIVADGRPLADATVEVLPMECSIDSPMAVVDPSDPCLPRSAQTTSAVDGSFALAVDPGGYLLRVRPADGSRLPWVTQSIMVGLGSLILPRLTIPAPVSVGMRLTLGYDTNAISNAIVRVFTDPSQGPAIELGRAVTDSNGNYEMYLAPSSEPLPAGF
jgi:hypothetical protein